MNSLHSRETKPAAVMRMSCCNYERNYGRRNNRSQNTPTLPGNDDIGSEIARQENHPTNVHQLIYNPGFSNGIVYPSRYFYQYWVGGPDENLAHIILQDRVERPTLIGQRFNVINTKPTKPHPHTIGILWLPILEGTTCLLWACAIERTRPSTMRQLKQAYYD